MYVRALVKIYWELLFDIFISSGRILMKDDFYPPISQGGENPRRLTPSMPLLLAFEASARHLSFTRAAQELSLTQSAVSRHVKALEDLLEVPLFRREGRTIALTDIGKMYQGELKAALQRIRNASLQAIAYRKGGG